MTNLARTWAALTISVLAGVTAGCASPAEAPAARAKATASTQPTTQTPVEIMPAPASATPKPGTGKFAYCAPLAVADAFEEKMSSGKDQTVAAKELGKLLVPAIAAATADGKTDVAEFLNLFLTVSADPMHITAKQNAAIRAGMTKTTPVILKDCGIDMTK
jgi:hypothetical protein